MADCFKGHCAKGSCNVLITPDVSPCPTFPPTVGGFWESRIAEQKGPVDGEADPRPHAGRTLAPSH